MERLKPFQNHPYQQLQNFHLETNDYDVDECHLHQWIDNRLEVAIVDGDYKPAIDGPLGSTSKENSFVERRFYNNLPSPIEQLSLEDGNDLENMVQVAWKSDTKEWF